MAVMGTFTHPKALWEGVFEWFGHMYGRYSPEWVHLVDEKKSKKNYEEVVQTTSLGLAPVKTETLGISFSDLQQGYTTRATHVTYGLGYIVSREKLEDNLYLETSLKGAEILAESMHQTKETVVANMYNRAFNSSYTFGDGKELLATDHPLTSGGTLSNELSTPAVLSEAALEDLTIQIAQATDDVGLKIQLRAECLVVPVQLQYEAYRILNAVQRVGTADNDPNAIKDMGVFPKGVKVNHYLTDANNWFIRTNVTRGGLTLYNRRPVEFAQDNDFDTENLKAKSTMRFSVTCADPRALYGSAPA